ncbi:MAG TPA: zf-HC2 domain-containing protein [Pseudonocardiaceae bacterium]|nr:zf-HC2 domain-containing protein [Pseudonocardiaceae bacterium]
MDCTQCREALSARLDGEESAPERDALDAHLVSCAACRRFAEQAARVTRLARTAVATQEPDVVAAVLAAAPRSRRPRLVNALRVLLGLVGLAQIEIALVGVLTAQSGGHGSQGVILEGASIAHLAHESAAWNLALGVGFLWIARRSPRTSGMVPTLVTFVAVLAGLVVLDVVAGRVDPQRFLLHGLVLLGLILVMALERLPRPTGGVAPGVSGWGQLRSRPSRPADPVWGSDADELPPDLRPTAAHDGAAAPRRRSA